MKRGLILLVALIIVPFVTAQPTSCFIATNCSNVSMMPNISLTYDVFGYVSMQGHFSSEPVIPGFSNTYSLCCPDLFTLNDATYGPAFKFSPINPPVFNGSGHVQSADYSDFTEQVFVGADCDVKASCDVGETCLFKLSDPLGGHVADCHNLNNPMSNLYAYSMCCKLTEICWDGIDNDGDGFIDCADPDCNGVHAFPAPATEPQICTNFLVDPPVSSPYTTSGCIIRWDEDTQTTIYDPDCIGQNPNPPLTHYYCGFGMYDDPTDEPTGVCCPVGTRPQFDEGKWSCIGTAQCGLDPLLRCDYDFDLNTPDWYSSVFAGNVNEWCNTQVTNLLYPLPDDIPPSLNYEGSTGCCLIPKFGQINYWVDVGNVKIYG